MRDGQLTSRAPASEVLVALRNSTAARHGLVDRTMPLSRPRPTHADYIEHVRLIHAWLSPLEYWLDTSTNCQTALIDADLADVGVHPARARTFEVPRQWPADACAAHRWGARYVVEGSRLGAAVLYRQLRFALHPHPLHYLRGNEGESTDRWPRFLRELGEAVRTPTDIADACAGACERFDALLALIPRAETGFKPKEGYA